MSYEFFKKQLAVVVKHYPDLTVVCEGGESFLRGKYEIYDAAGNFQETYEIEIKYKKGFPKRFPKLFEIGEKLPRISDWHIHGDGSCCLDVPPGEILACYNSITILRFLENQVRAYLAKQTYRRKEGYYPGKEYEHNYEIALLQFYAKELKMTEEKEEILKILRFLIVNPKANGNVSCPCESGKSLKKCHKQIFARLLKLGKFKILNNYESILTI